MPSDAETLSQNDHISPGTARSLANHGITAINSADKIILKRNGSVIANVAKTSSSLLGPAISVLDAGAARGLLRIQTRANIDRFAAKTNNPTATAKLQHLLSKGDHAGVALKLLEHGFRYKNLNDLTSR